MNVVRPLKQRIALPTVQVSLRTTVLCALLTVALPACARVGTGYSPTPQPTDRPSEPVTTPPDERSAPDTRGRAAGSTPARSQVEPSADAARPNPGTEDERLPEDAAEVAYLAWLEGPDEIRESAEGKEDLEERVEFWMTFWQGRGRGYFERYLTRMAIYQPVVDRALMERGLPPTLRYLPLIESGYSPVAVSRVGATGLWQFMSPTARWLGMRVDGFVDERRDPLRSTEEALGYLETLRRDFGSWYLALAAYNAGPGRIGGILRRNAPGATRGDSLFWAMVEKFPRETTFYVPKLLAAAELSGNPENYGFEAPNRADSLAFENVDVEGATSLDVIAEAANVPVEEIINLNTHLVQRVTPINTHWMVRVPRTSVEGFAERLALVPPDERVTFIQHRVASGETMGHIAGEYGIRLSQLRAANPGVRPQRLQIGQRLIIPRGPSSSRDATTTRVASTRAAPTATADASNESSTSAQPADALRAASTSSGSNAAHIVRSGESPWTISRRYGVGLDELLAWNDLDRGSVLRPGDRLQVHGSAGAGTTVATRVREYRVRSGDTLSQIAERHGVSTGALIRHNGLSSRSVIKPGQRIRIPAA